MLMFLFYHRACDAIAEGKTGVKAELERFWEVAQSLQKCLQKILTFFSETSFTLTCLF